MKRTWEQRAAKRIVGEASLRAALQEIEKACETGGARSSLSSDYRIAQHLAQHAAEQLRLAEEPS